MTTEKQIAANRLNALKSTGPKTPEGKAAVRLNALRHGFRARVVVLPGENREEFQKLCDNLEAEWRPQTCTEQFMVETMAVSQWKLARLEFGEHSIFEQSVPAKQQLPLIASISQHQYRLERSYFRAMRELERLQKTRPQRLEHQEPEQEPISTPSDQPEASHSPEVAASPRPAVAQSQEPVAESPGRRVAASQTAASQTAASQTQTVSPTHT